MNDPLPMLPLQLSGLEVVHLLDSVRNGTTVKDVEDELGVTKPLIVKLGGIYRELVSPAGIKAGPVDVQVSEQEAWVLRAKVKTGDIGIDGQTPVGITLSLKLYELLALFSPDMPQIEVGGEEAPFSVNQKEALKALQKTEEINERRDDEPGKDAHGSPIDKS